MVSHVLQTDTALLGAYLNDHFARAGAGVDLSRRLANTQHDTPAGRELERILREVAADRESLLSIMDTLHLPVRRRHGLAAWASSKTGLLVDRRSPLNGILQLEALLLAVERTAACWRTLRAVADNDSRLDAHHLDDLAGRARGQIDTLKELLARAVADTIVG
jgi:hypothetical protein